MIKAILCDQTEFSLGRHSSDWNKSERERKGGANVSEKNKITKVMSMPLPWDGFNKLTFSLSLRKLAWHGYTLPKQKVDERRGKRGKRMFQSNMFDTFNAIRIDQCAESVRQSVGDQLNKLWANHTLAHPQAPAPAHTCDASFSSCHTQNCKQRNNCAVCIYLGPRWVRSLCPFGNFRIRLNEIVCASHNNNE